MISPTTRSRTKRMLECFYNVGRPHFRITWSVKIKDKSNHRQRCRRLLKTRTSDPLVSSPLKPLLGSTPTLRPCSPDLPPTTGPGLGPCSHNEGTRQQVHAHATPDTGLRGQGSGCTCRARRARGHDPGSLGRVWNRNTLGRRGPGRSEGLQAGLQRDLPSRR